MFLRKFTRFVRLRSIALFGILILATSGCSLMAPKVNITEYTIAEPLNNRDTALTHVQSVAQQFGFEDNSKRLIEAYKPHFNSNLVAAYILDRRSSSHAAYGLMLVVGEADSVIQYQHLKVSLSHRNMSGRKTEKHLEIEKELTARLQGSFGSNVQLQTLRYSIP